MGETQGQAKNLYQQRLNKEFAIEEGEIAARMRWDLPILSTNTKCSVSLDLPLANCQPTSVCSEVCYAAQGRQCYRRSIVKSIAVNRLIDLDPEHVARKMVDEAAGRTIRLAGSGEILPKHKTLVSCVTRFGSDWWGITRRVDTHCAMPSLMFSLDASTPEDVQQYVREEVPVTRRTYLRRPQDPPCSLHVAVTFPVHGPRTNYAENVPRHPTDCQVDRNELNGCWSCKRCY